MRIITANELVFRAKEGLCSLVERKILASNRLPEIDLPAGRDSYLPNILINTFEEREPFCLHLRESFAESIQETISYAEDIVNNRFLIFSELVDFGEAVDWNLEFVSDIHIPLKFYRDIKFLNPHEAGDKKFVWELNRHNFLIFLGKAYWVTDDRKYFEKWKELILSWIENNPYNRGINWASSLELAIRIINWIWSYYFFIDELKHNHELQKEILHILYLHAVHIERHLSTYFSPNTHLTGEALGLLYIGKAFPFLNRSQKWVSLAENLLNHELKRQILNDGGYFEMTTYYHKYTLDFYIHYLLLESNGNSLNDEVLSRISRLAKHLLFISEPDGTIPLFGDSDGGQLLFFNMKKNNIMGACCAAAVLLDDPEIKHLCGSSIEEETFWLLGNTGWKQLIEMNELPVSSYHSLNFASGVFCFRSGMAEDDSHILIDCGPHGWKVCGHAHSDLLSFEWYCDGAKVIVDPGTYTYTGSRDMRDKNRVSQSHNTITINEISQSVPKNIFRWKSIAHPKHVFAEALAEFGYFEGMHDAYDNLGCQHKRIVLYSGSELSIILDIIYADLGISSLLYNLQFNEGELHAFENELYRFRSKRDGHDRYVRIMSSSELISSIIESEIHPDYFKSLQAPRLNITKKDTTGKHIIVSILTQDIRLAQSFILLKDNELRGNSDSSEYSFSIKQCSFSPGDNDAIPCSLTSFSNGKDTLVLMLRNANSVSDNNRIIYRSEENHTFLLGKLMNGILELKTDRIPESFEFPYEMTKLIINSSIVAFAKKNSTYFVKT